MKGRNKGRRRDKERYILQGRKQLTSSSRVVMALLVKKKSLRVIVFLLLFFLQIVIKRLKDFLPHHSTVRKWLLSFYCTKVYAKRRKKKTFFLLFPLFFSSLKRLQGVVWLSVRILV